MLTIVLGLLQLFNLPEQWQVTQPVVVQGAHIAFTSVLFIALLFSSQKSQSIPVRFFWFCIKVALVCWLLTKIGLLAFTFLGFPQSTYLLADYGYFAFFLVMVFSLLLYNSAHHQDNKFLSFQALLMQYGALLFMGAMFVYLVVIPNQNQSLEFAQHFSSFLFFILMDVYLVLAFFSQSKAASRKDWNRRFLYLSLTFASFFLLDLVELMIRAEIFHFQIEGILSLFWYSPYFFLVLAFCQKENDSPIVPEAPPNWLPNPILFMLPILPVLHFAGYFTGLFEQNLRETRESILVIWVLLYAGILYFFDRHKPLSQKPETQHNPDGAKTEVNPLNNVPDTPLSQIEINHIPYPLLLLDSHGKIEAANNATTALTGYSTEQLQGLFFTALLASDEPLEPIFRFAEGNFSKSKLVTSGTREIRVHHKNGDTLFCYVRLSEVSKHRFSVCLMDITKLHQAEAQALSIKDKFLANITHEFRTPLTIIQGAVEEGEEKSDSPALKQRFTAARSNVSHILKMVEQLLNLSKITSAPKLAKTAQPASEIMKDCCLQFAHLCQNKHIQFHHDIDEKIWVDVHEDSLQQVLYNLLSNAYKYTPGNGDIRFIAKQHDSHLSIDITDTGCGMNEEEQARLFERFQRADISKSSSTFGVGIGLSLISELVQLHHWKIKVSSTPGTGSTFSLTLPTVSEPSDANVDIKPISFETEKQMAKPLSSSAGLKETSNQNDLQKSADRLLIIEDNLDMQDYLRHLLSPLYQTDIIGRGQAGLEFAVKEIPDLIICDLMLPDISGYDVIDGLKQNPLTQHIPTLMLTAKSDIQSKLSGLENRADDYLTKPFHHKELQLRLQNLLNIREKVQGLLRQQMTQSALEKAKRQAMPKPTLSNDINPHQDFLARLQNLAQNHFADTEFGLSTLASQMAMSERQLQRKLKAALNMTPGEYIRQYRLIKSKGLLQQGLSVGHVSEAVGFSDPAYFARCFKHEMGASPSEFQRANQQDTEQ